MSIGDYLLPWKAIPNMIRDVKEAGGGSKDGKGKEGEEGSKKRQRNHSSVVGAVGKYADPLGALFGDRWMEFFHERLPSQMNEYASGIAQKDPFIQADRKWGLGRKGSPLRGVSNFAEDRPADTTALVLGSIFGGGALAGGMGGGSAGGGGGAAAGGGTSGGGFGGFNFANMNWQDPNTYMQLMGNMPGGQQQQVPPAQQPRPVPRPVRPSGAAPSSSLYAVLAQLARTRRA